MSENAALYLLGFNRSWGAKERMKTMTWTGGKFPLQAGRVDGGAGAAICRPPVHSSALFAPSREKSVSGLLRCVRNDAMLLDKAPSYRKGVA